jgi:hypothetical protein
MFTNDLRYIDSVYHKIKVNRNWKRYNRIADIFKTNSLTFSNYETFYEVKDWSFTLVFGKRCRFKDIYILTYALDKIGVFAIHISCEDNTDIFVGESSHYEGGISECMHIEFVLIMNPLKSLDEIITIYQDYRYKNNQGYSKSEIEEFDKEIQEAQEDFYSNSNQIDSNSDFWNDDDEHYERGNFQIPLKHYSPEDVLTFGVNNGNTLKDIYHYMPKYIEWLIKYHKGFEIDIREFESLPKPVKVEPGLAVTKSKLRDRVDFSVSSIKNYIETKRGNLNEIEFKFTIESIEILEFKRLNKYPTPEYHKSQI